ncbi:transporter substrate-binding domain-containing protein [Methyloraptor flagellatus]|jgi:cyclohexadienyl dehydratase|uniref:Transporter substrate-binding domain-containing protein n=1 Tax=Methyloraptor flagellatus TaxID=3162530 RepID=A0AAU7XBY4_9HYPH
MFASIPRRVRTLALAAGLAVAVSAPLAAPTVAAEASRLDEIVSRGVLRVGTTGDYRPFTYLNKETGQYEGYDIDMANALATALGVKLELVGTSWPTLAKDFEADKFDVAMGGVSITLDRQKKGLFTIPIMREGKTPIVRCGDVAKFQTVADIDKPGVRVIVNPGGTNERFDRANFKTAEIKVHPNNVEVFDEVAKGNADVMITDASETLFQQKLHPGVLCAVHPDKPFDFAEKGYWLQRDGALKAFVDQWLHISGETGATAKVYAKWFN